MLDDDSYIDKAERLLENAEDTSDLLNVMGILQTGMALEMDADKSRRTRSRLAKLIKLLKEIRSDLIICSLCGQDIDDESGGHINPDDPPNDTLIIWP